MRLSLAVPVLVVTAAFARPLGRGPRPAAPATALASPEPEPAIAIVPAAAPAPASATPGPPSAPAAPVDDDVHELAVDGDLPAFVVRAARDGHPAPIVFLTGSCTSPRPSLEAFRHAAAEHGGVLALQGELPCPGDDPTLRKWSPDASLTSARIDAALRAAGATRTHDLVLMGYSQGADRAEWLAKRFRAKYTRFVLMAGPGVPAAARLGAARAVVTMAAPGDVRESMALGARHLRRAGVPALYLEIPGRKHGELPDAVDPWVGRALDWLDRNARPASVPGPDVDAELLGEDRVVVDRRAQRRLREPDPAAHRVERRARGGRDLRQ